MADPRPTAAALAQAEETLDFLGDSLRAVQYDLHLNVQRRRRFARLEALNRRQIAALKQRIVRELDAYPHLYRRVKLRGSE